MALTPTEEAAATRGAAYNDDRYDASTNPYGLGGEGYQTNWPQGMNDTATLVNATAREAAAAGAAAGTAITATSATSLAIGTGTRNFTIETGKAFVAGQPVKIAYSSDPTAKYMLGEVTSYDSGTGAMSVTVTSVAGSGTYADWTVHVTTPITYPVSNTANTVVIFTGTDGKSFGEGPAYGTAANNLLQLNGSAQLPPVDASLVTGAGGLHLIASASANNDATIDFTSGIDGTYDRFVLTGSLLTVQTDNTVLDLRVTQDGGVSWLAENYAYIVGSPQAYNTISTAGGASTTLIQMVTSGIGGAAGETCSFVLEFDLPSNASVYKTFQFQVTSFDNAAGLQAHVGSGAYTGNTSAIDGIRIFVNSGNILTGEFHLYGMRKV